MASSSHINNTPSRDWTLCFICQEDRDDQCLQYPMNHKSYQSKPETLELVYFNMLNNIKELRDLGELPAHVSLIDYGGGFSGEGYNTDGDGANGGGSACDLSRIVKLMMDNQVAWHKFCRNSVDKQKVDRARQRQRKRSLSPTSSSPVKTRRASFTSSSTSGNSSSGYSPTEVCFLCEKETNENLTKASTLGLDAKVRSCATRIGDKILIGKLSEGDMIALEAKYHLSCLAQLHRRAAASEMKSSESIQTSVLKAQAFSDLVEYIESFRGSQMSFPMGDITKLYESRLCSLGIESKGHSTRLRQDIEDCIPDIKVIKNLSGTYNLAFDEHISQALETISSNQDVMADMRLLQKASKLLREKIFSAAQSFDGSFTKNCGKDSVPQMLLSFVQMLLDGPNIIPQNPDESNKEPSNASISISQQIVFNAVKCRSSRQGTTRHSKAQETPQSIYTAVKVHLKSGKSTLVDCLHGLGMCISYHRLRSISMDIANSVLTYWKQTGVVVPLQAVKDVFSVMTIDNIDHNPTSTTARSSLHGTLVSLLQFPTNDNTGTPINRVTMNPDVMGQKFVEPLPAEYTTVGEIALQKDGVKIPNTTCDSHPVIARPPVEQLISDQYPWLQDVYNTIEHNDLQQWISWGAYHADKSEVPSEPNTLCHPFPIFTEPANNPSTLYHCMNVIKAAVDFINPGQTPVVAVDQPLYAYCKLLQWNFPDTHGEDKFVIILGGLHIEKMLLQILGDWMDGSGWTTALSNGDVTNIGTANSFIGVSHIAKARYAHEVTAASLYILENRAYADYCQNTGDNPLLDRQHWIERQTEQQPQAYFWHTALKLELLVLEFVKCEREAEFTKSLEILDSLLPWVFALDHYNYARNIPVYLRDMATLSERHPAVFCELERGHIVGQKSKRPFSKIPLDQMQEQIIEILKADGTGIIGKTEDPATLRCHQVALPELSRLIQEYESTQQTSTANDLHHEQYNKFQQTFKRDVQGMVEAMEDLGNPYREDTGQLLDLNTSAVMPAAVVHDVRNAEQIGEARYREFLDKRILSDELAFSDTVKRQSLKLLSHRASSISCDSALSKKEKKMDIMQLLIAANSGRNIKTPLCHENSLYPPAFTQNGHMHSGTKSDILQCLLEDIPLAYTCPETTAIILDGAVIAQMLSPKVGNAATFQDYVESVFMPYILWWLQRNERVDVVFDVYTGTASLKKATRDKRGNGIRLRVTKRTKVPKNWQSFLRVDANKEELFKLLAEEVQLTVVPQGKLLVSTIGSLAVSSPIRDLSGISPCTHEEADTRLMLHIADSTLSGHRNVMVRTSDSDVVIIAVSCFKQLQLDQLWVAFGTGRAHMKYIPVHLIAGKLGPERASALPAFHALTGCDQVSSFYGHGKKSAWAVWESYPQLTVHLQSLSARNATLESVESAIPVLQMFTNLLYKVGDETIATVNEARFHLIHKKCHDFEKLPPTLDALRLHAMRATYQGGHIWGNALFKQATPPSPNDWGWEQNTGFWRPVYTTKPIISSELEDLVICHCSKKCRPPCKCVKTFQRCMSLCRCQGTCYGDQVSQL